VMSHKPWEFMNAVKNEYALKDGKIHPPEEYLGAQVKAWTLEDAPDVKCWAMSSEKYVKNAIREVEAELSNSGKRLQTKISTPLSPGYHPELDTTREATPDQASYYQNMIGVLRWAVELGRVDIHNAVSQMSSHLAMPRAGHLEQCFHIFAYLKAHERSHMVFDPTYPKFDESIYNKTDWSSFYPDAKEAIPADAPAPRGLPVTMQCFVDANHAGCHVTRRSHTGVIIYVNRAPILWFSKRQNTVETSTFGSEFVAMRIATEMIEGLRYKLRMMGVPIDGPTSVFNDNQSVVHNTTKPESTLKKKHNAIAYHRVREAVASGTIIVAKVDSKEILLSDLLTEESSRTYFEITCFVHTMVIRQRDWTS